MSISALVLNSLLFLIFLKLGGLCLSLSIVLRLGASVKFLEFWKEYWDWKYVKDNVVNLSIWFVTLVAYAYCYHMLHGVRERTIAITFAAHPIAASFVVAATFWLLLSTAMQTISSVRHTAVLCSRIGRASLLKKLGKMAVFLSLSYFEISGWPFLLGTFIGIAIPRLMMNFAIEKKVARAVEQFIFVAMVEYALRASVVITALYVETGHLRLW